MSDFDAILEIKKNLLEEILRDSEDNKVDLKAIVDGRLKVVNEMQTKNLENTKEYKAFAERIRQELVRDNAYLQIYLQDEEEWDIPQPTLDEAKQNLLNDENNFIEFLTEDSMRKYTYNLLREIVGEII